MTRDKVNVVDTESWMVFLGGHPSKCYSHHILCVQCQENDEKKIMHFPNIRWQVNTSYTKHIVAHHLMTKETPLLANNSICSPVCSRLDYCNAILHARWHSSIYRTLILIKLYTPRLPIELVLHQLAISATQFDNGLQCVKEASDEDDDVGLFAMIFLDFEIG